MSKRKAHCGVKDVVDERSSEQLKKLWLCEHATRCEESDGIAPEWRQPVNLVLESDSPSTGIPFVLLILPFRLSRKQAKYERRPMKRAVSEIGQSIYDIVVVGGGVYGASVARDAAMRGLKVALVDQGDFGSATSANSHKIIHGGLRYLQHGDFKRMRESIRERSNLMRIAPHLVFPMPFLIPIFNNLGKGKCVFFAAMKLNDFVSFDRNRKLPSDKKIPNGRIISKTECLTLCPALNSPELVGGAIYYDGQIYNPNRLILSFLHSAVLNGADVANYVRVKEIIVQNNKVQGLKVMDELTKESFRLKGAMVVNCTGPWNNSILKKLELGNDKLKPGLTKAMVLVTRSLTRDIAIGILCKDTFFDKDAIINKGHRYLFAAPWREYSLIGTLQRSFEGEPHDFTIKDEDIDDFIQQIQRAWPTVTLERKDVSLVNAGLLPSLEEASFPNQRGDRALMKNYQVQDHLKLHGLDGLLSVVGVKFTTARGVAEQTVNIVMKRLGKRFQPSQTAKVPSYGGDIAQFQDFANEVIQETSASLSGEVSVQLAKNYGSQYRKVLSYANLDRGWLKSLGKGVSVIGAEVIHGIREEMAQSLGDVVFRRTELGTGGFPGHQAIELSAKIMAQELGWSQKRTTTEVEQVLSTFWASGVPHQELKKPSCVFS